MRSPPSPHCQGASRTRASVSTFGRMARPRRRISVLLATIVTATIALTGCGIRIPTDPSGSLDRITGGDLRVGASPAKGTVDVDGDEVSGPVATAVEGFAASRDARIVWTIGSEEELVDDLEDGRLDLAIGGMTEQSPWSERVSVTRAYPALSDEGRKVVLLLPMGENALQSVLEEFLDEEVGQ